MLYLFKILCGLAIICSLVIDSRFFVFIFLLIFFLDFYLNDIELITLACLSLWLKYDVNVGFVFVVLSVLVLVDKYMVKRFNLVIVRVVVSFGILILFFEILDDSLLSKSTFVILGGIYLTLFLVKRFFIVRDSKGIFVDSN